MAQIWAKFNEFYHVDLRYFNIGGHNLGLRSKEAKLICLGLHLGVFLERSTSRVHVFVSKKKKRLSIFEPQF